MSESLTEIIRKCLDAEFLCREEDDRKMLMRDAVDLLLEAIVTGKLRKIKWFDEDYGTNLESIYYLITETILPTLEMKGVTIIVKER